MARTRKEISQKTFESLCKMQCSESEICEVLGVTDKPLVRWCRETYGCNFSEAYKMFSAQGKASLRRTQFKLAEKSAAMAIFLGKNILGQADNPLPQAGANDLLTALQGYAKALVDK